MAPRRVLRLASLPRLLAADLIDLFAIAAPAGFVAMLAFPAQADAPSRPGDPILDTLDAIVQQPMAIAVFAGAALALSVIHQAVLVSRLGATLGGLAFGVRLVRRRDGRRPGLPRAAVRGLMSALGTLACGVGPLYALWLDAKRRGLGDVVAGTLPVLPVREGNDGR